MDLFFPVGFVFFVLRGGGESLRLVIVCLICA